MRSLLLLALALTALGQSVPVGVLAARLDRRYNSIHSWQADFTQIYTSGLETRTESGHLYLQKPGKMRWDYLEPTHKEFLVAGNQVWQYTAGDPQATVGKIANLDDLRTPLRFLLGHTDLPKELAGLSYSGLDVWQPGDVVIHGFPQAAATAGWREVWIEVTPDDAIDRLLILGLDGGQNDIRLSHIEINPSLPAKLFRFTPPAGVAVVPGAGPG